MRAAWAVPVLAITPPAAMAVAAGPMRWVACAWMSSFRSWGSGRSRKAPWPTPVCPKDRQGAGALFGMPQRSLARAREARQRLPTRMGTQRWRQYPHAPDPLHQRRSGTHPAGTRSRSVVGSAAQPVPAAASERSPVLRRLAPVGRAPAAALDASLDRAGTADRLRRRFPHPGPRRPVPGCGCGDAVGYFTDAAAQRLGGVGPATSRPGVARLDSGAGGR